MSIASGYGPNWTTAEGRAVDLQKRVVELEQQLAAALAKARALRALVTEFADELERRLAAIAPQPAERESRPMTFTQGVLCSLSILDGYGDSIAYREVANPHDLNQLWAEADEFDREHLARHGFCPVPAAQGSGDA